LFSVSCLLMLSFTERQPNFCFGYLPRCRLHPAQRQAHLRRF
jgi:hypothetical protein